MQIYLGASARKITLFKKRVLWSLCSTIKKLSVELPTHLRADNGKLQCSLQGLATLPIVCF